MRELSGSGQQAINDIAYRTGFSPDAVMSMLGSVLNGNGGMAQFNHPEFGGYGQWMRGGMTMVSDMFNNHLKGRVDGLCFELSNLIASQPNLFVPGTSNDWWPADLRWPNSTGAQNGVRYAYFGQARRLAIDVGGRVTVYDTLDHQISGFSQQQSGSGSISLSSQYGLIDVASLPVVSGEGAQGAAPAYRVPQPQPFEPSPANGADPADIFGTIEKLAALQAKGYISAEEFAAKKSELLGRL
ncbi:SHOCT domain-containing protein [Aquabacterium sp.]|uniref:SHOCT domain-containing protein n=1 Tax=Aquabacterium sp. TaxID=1872578 RepID=UPI0019B71525|nr:SHOCT domain-containing protein [Aquabacterium sp.]MBC7700241.1 SHOCT domain-containing protein [Aquabacterium sp.]